jgi:hypothetical protein
VHEIVAENDNNTYEDEDTIHIIFEGMDPGFLVTCRFLDMKRQQGIGAVLEIPDHARSRRSGIAIITRYIFYACMFLTC